ncbi:MAG TPA: hypothetical protein PKU97_10915 [Kofleriaceae bacterium]|nr:hypothetical protein [Kofleriaceae bacterium]
MTERRFDPSSGVFGDVLVESARQGVGGEDALDRGVAERAKRSCMGERAVDLVGAVARAQEQDLPGLRAPAAGRACAHQPEKLGGAVAHVGEGDLELIEVDRRMPLRRRVQARRVELEPRTARGELVAGDAAQIGGVHEQLALGDPDRQQIGDVVVGHGVVVAAPGVAERA